MPKRFLFADFTIVTYLIISLLIVLGTSLVYSFFRLLVAIYEYYQSHFYARFEYELNRRTYELISEREKLANLLHRVLPRETASELQRTGRVDNKECPQSTVLFSDVVGFSAIVDAEDSETLLDFLDHYIFALDGLAERHHVEKIKTIGDAYMCVGGMEKYDKANPVRVVLMAMEMLDTLDQLNQEFRMEAAHWGIRIGIATGTVTSGILGRNKLSLDIWGATVNNAKRMESAGAEGRINISEETYNIVHRFFECEHRGKITIKNGKQLVMYFVKGITPALSEDGKGQHPNHDFYVQYQLLRLTDLSEYIYDWLEAKLPKDLYYHNTRHTQDVVIQAEIIGRAEGITDEQLLLLETAALLHDSGYVISYTEHERIGVEMAYQTLPNFGYSREQINEIARLIMATQMPVHPKDLLEEIICDADLDYLGRLDYTNVAHALYQELHERGMVGDEAAWVGQQIEFINRHQYYTETARQKRELPKQRQLQELLAWQQAAARANAKSL